MSDDCRMALTPEEARELISRPYDLFEREELLSDLLTELWPTWAEIPDEEIRGWGRDEAFLELDSLSVLQSMDCCPDRSRVTLTLWN